MRKLLLVLVLLPTLIFADAVIFSGNDVKALKANLNLFDVAKLLTTSTDPSSSGLDAPIGSIAMETVTGNTYIKTGSSVVDWTINRKGLVNLASEVSGILPILNGGTGSSTQNFVDLTTDQTIAGIKIFSSPIVTNGQSITNVQATNVTSTHVIGSPIDITNLERVIDHMWSAGVTDGALLTNNGDGTINLSTSTTMFRRTVPITITSAAGVATATDTAHGFQPGDDVYISGANEAEYNGSFIVQTVPTVDTFTYNIQGAPASPATGTIVAGGAHSPIYTAQIPAQNNISLTDNSINYVYADYNGGTPQYGVTTSLANTNCIDKCIAYTIGREGTTLYIIDARGMNVDANRKERRRLLETQGFQHVIGGSAIGETGTRNLTVTEGYFYYILNKIYHPAFDTSATDTFKYYYQTAPGTWTFTAASTQIDNLQYDTGTGLGTLSNNKYGVHWIYILLDSPSTLVVQYGQGDYSTLADAEAAGVPTAPPAIQSVGVLIGRVVIQKSAATFASIDSAFAQSFVPSTATSHNGLSGLQGGTSGEYYHLTSSEYTGTGTGTVVRQSSPTLVTPNLGTPSVATLTNATGLPLTTGVTGVLDETNGGTGQSTIATGDLLYGSATNTISKLSIGSATKRLSVSSGSVAWTEEDRSNLLVNPNFEDVTLTGWTCTTGTCSSTTTSGEYSEGSAAYKIVPSSNAFDVSQTVNMVSGTVKQHIVGLNYRIPATCSGIALKVTVDGGSTPQSTVTSSNLILDDTYHTIEIPTTASTSIKLNPTAATTCTGNVFFDKAYIKQGLGTQALQLDNVYSATLSGSPTGAVSQLSKPNWISCSNGGTGVSTCTFPVGQFTANPNCVASIAENNNVIAAIQVPATPSGVTVRVFATGTLAASSGVVNLICQKSGNDYLASSAAVYSQSSANFSGTIQTTMTIGAVTTPPTKGTIVTDRIVYGRYGNRLNADFQFETSVAGTAGTGDYLFTLPNGYSFDSNEVFFYTGSAVTTNAKSVIGYGQIDATTAVLVAYDATRFRVYFNSPTANGFMGSTLYNLATIRGFTFRVDAAISGWSNSSTIVGTFAGTPKVPGLDSNVDTFSVSYGTTNATTVCSASPCSYLDQIGTAVSSVTRSATGTYAINTARTYSKLKCTVGTTELSVSNGLSCSNCTSVSWVTIARATGTNTDSYGNVSCQGSY